MVRACGKVLALVGEGENGEILTVLEASGFDVLAVQSGEEALARAAGERPCAVVLDLDGNEASGYLACKILRERNGELLPIVLLSGERTTASDRVVGLLLGADDYIVKPVDPSELAARLHRLVARSATRSPGSAVAVEGPVEDFDLTKRERQVMIRLFDGMTQSDIAKELVISPNTVATHIQHILSKLGVHTRAQAVAKVAHAGWIERERAPEEPEPSQAPLSVESPTTTTAGLPAPKRRRASTAPTSDALTTTPSFEVGSP